MQTITLESLLYDTNNELSNVDDISIECMDLFIECSTLQNNLTVYETAKTIKLSQDVSCEDAIIVSLENGFTDTLKKLKDSLIKLWEKIKTFLGSIVQKLKEVFQVDERFLQKNRALIEKGLSNPGDIKVDVVKDLYSNDGLRQGFDSFLNLQSFVTEFVEEVNKKYYEDPDDNLYDITALKFDEIWKRFKEQLEIVNVGLFELKASFDDLELFFGKYWKQIQSNLQLFKEFASNTIREIKNDNTGGNDLRAKREKFNYVKLFGFIMNKTLTYFNKLTLAYRASSINIANAAIAAGK